MRQSDQGLCFLQMSHRHVFIFINVLPNFFQFLKLQGKPKRGKEEINIMDVNTADFISTVEVTKSLSEEQEHRSHKKKDMPSSQQRRKHQIGYLAFQVGVCPWGAAKWIIFTTNNECCGHSLESTLTRNFYCIPTTFLCLGLSVCPFICSSIHMSCFWDLSYARILKFHVCIAYEKLADSFSFFFFFFLLFFSVWFFVL